MSRMLVSTLTQPNSVPNHLHFAPSKLLSIFCSQECACMIHQQTPGLTSLSLRSAPVLNTGETKGLGCASRETKGLDVGGSGSGNLIISKTKIYGGRY